MQRRATLNLKRLELREHVKRVYYPPALDTTERV